MSAVLPRTMEGLSFTSPENPEARNCRFFPPIPPTLFLPPQISLVDEICSGLRLACPADQGNAAILHRMAPKKRRVRWLSAKRFAGPASD